MDFPEEIKQQTCADCLSGVSLGFRIRMAFQPIIDWQTRKIFAYEALVRGPDGQGAGWVFEQINETNKYYFDQACRITAIKTASELGCDTFLSINFLPNAVYNPQTCIKATIEAAHLYNFDLKKLIFEVTEGENIIDKAHLRNIFQSYAKFGFLTAIDDYGAGYTHISWLSELKPHVLKLDMSLIRDIDKDPLKQVQIREIKAQCDLQCTQLLAEGIETLEELECLTEMGIRYLQGYLFAKPSLEHLTTAGDIQLLQANDL